MVMGTFNSKSIKNIKFSPCGTLTDISHQTKKSAYYYIAERCKDREDEGVSIKLA